MHRDIDLILANYGLFHLENFAYTIGECLFNAMEVLLEFTYTSLELRKGTIEYFQTCFKKQDMESIESYQKELNAFSLMEMHNANDPKAYLQKMSRLASI